MAEVNFSDEVAAATWLKSQSVEMQCAIGSRAALRVCANLGQLEGDSFEHVALPSFRATLTTAVRGLGRPADVDWLERTSSVSSAAAFSSARNIFSLSDADPSIATGASAAAFSSAFAASAAMASAFSSSSSSSADATSFDASKEDLTEYRAALWAGAEVPPAIEAAHRAFLIKLEADRSTWGFWHDWYLAMWEGRFKDWDLATAVSKIPDDVWEDGAEAVAFEIKQIKAKLDLKGKIETLKKELRQANATGRPAHRHHNNPPSEAVIQDQQGISSSVTLIWDQLERLETEIEKPEPSLPKLKAIANALWEISVKIAAFCGSLANVALKESAKTVGGTGTKAAIGVLATTTAAQNEGVKAVVRAVWEFVKTLP